MQHLQCSSAAQASRQAVLRPSPPSAAPPPAAASPQQHATTRRDLGLGLVASLVLAQAPLPARAADDGLTKYVPTPDKTPALRSGVIKPDTRYSFSVPATAKEQRIVNVLTGNFCLPNCGEPWLESVWEEPALGKVQLLAIPLLKLTNAKEAKVTALGSPEELLQRIGAYLTGSYFDEDSVVSASSKQQDDGITYYVYELNQLDATNGPHSITAATTKGEVLFMFVTSATDRQWSKAEPVLRKVVDSFRA